MQERPPLYVSVPFYLYPDAADHHLPPVVCVFVFAHGLLISTNTMAAVRDFSVDKIQALLCKWSLRTVRMGCSHTLNVNVSCRSLYSHSGTSPICHVRQKQEDFSSASFFDML